MQYKVKKEKNDMKEQKVTIKFSSTEEKDFAKTLKELLKSKIIFFYEAAISVASLCLEVNYEEISGSRIPSAF